MELQDARTVQEAIAAFMAAGSPAKAELIRGLDDTQSFAVLIDGLPHAIEAGEADRVIALLKMWGAWHELYPVDRAIEAMSGARASSRGPVDKSAGAASQQEPAGQAAQDPAGKNDAGWDF